MWLLHTWNDPRGGQLAEGQSENEPGGPARRHAAPHLPLLQLRRNSGCFRPHRPGRCKMKPPPDSHPPDEDQLIVPVGYDFGLKRRSFVQVLGAGFLLAVSLSGVAQQGRNRGGNRVRTIAARMRFDADGTVTVLTGKVEGGQGARAELSQAAADELRVPFDRIRVVMGNTSLVPDDGITAGSGTTPRTVRDVRLAAAVARKALTEFAARQWGVDGKEVQVHDGAATSTGHPAIT